MGSTNRTLRRFAAAVAAAGLLATGCGDTPEETADAAASAGPGTPTASPSASETPDGVDATAASVTVEAAAVPAQQRPEPSGELPDSVAVHQPDVVLHTGPVRGADVDEIAQRDDVEHLAGGARIDLVVPAADGTEHVLTALVVDPVAFRPLTPAVTAQVPEVWERLLQGDVVVRHDIAHQLGLELGGEYTARGPAGSAPVRIGAYASNGAPPVADLLLPRELGSVFGAGDPNMLIVDVLDGTEPAAVGDKILGLVGPGDIDVRAKPETQQAQRETTGSYQFEPFSYTSLGDGMIAIDPAWVSRWIVRVELPRVGATRVHRVMAPQLLAAMEQIQREGLLEHFKPEQFGGGYVPRHIDWNPAKPLSQHAWGLAIDFNTHDNWLGQPPTMHPRIVEIFESWGFEWGGRWNRPDGMHFELDRVIHLDN